MVRNLKLLASMYARPLSAMSDIIDQGSCLFAVTAVVALGLVLNLWRPPAAAPCPRAAVAAVQAASAGAGTEPLAQMAVAALDRFTGRSSSGVIALLLILAAVQVPVAIVILAAWESLGACGTVLQRDYTPLLACAGMAWTAAYVPVAVGSVLARGAFAGNPWIWAAACLGFNGLMVCALRTLFGTSFGKAIVAAGAASAASVAGFMLYSAFGSLLSWLASPFFLFYAYRMFEGDVRMLGAGLRSRQSYKRHLEACTVNPHDSDAHYQLGLILQQRRRYSEAAASFERAVEIDPRETDAHFQLGGSRGSRGGWRMRRGISSARWRWTSGMRRMRRGGRWGRRTWPAEGWARRGRRWRNTWSGGRTIRRGSTGWGSRWPRWASRTPRGSVSNAAAKP